MADIYDEINDLEFEVVTMTDENGEQILDENGNPIPEDGTSGISYGDWEYTYHTPTEEEIDILKDLISVAEPSSATGNDEITNIITEEAEAFFKGSEIRSGCGECHSEPCTGLCK
mgnify:CR=1 FL=1